MKWYCFLDNSVSRDNIETVQFNLTSVEKYLLQPYNQIFFSLFLQKFLQQFHLISGSGKWSGSGWGSLLSRLFCLGSGFDTNGIVLTTTAFVSVGRR